MTKKLAEKYALAVTEAANEAAESLQGIRHLMTKNDLAEEEEHIAMLQGAAEFLSEWAKPL